jgi:hypothetical protein
MWRIERAIFGRIEAGKMISVSKRDVITALREIDKQGILNVNRSRLYCLVDGKHYPPKEVLKRAYLHATGKHLKKLHGGPQTNIPLQNAGWQIVSHCRCGNTCKVI